ncbi:hypothetical protein [Paenibacillus aquistagni]|uniref:Uncharacterized protein n=1 Tax=Paenibacillus aquistagni TaxID=1852522 RepID=A0A1X7LG04_9BACL|nr:hypothetical protein [Paenibacillus aquistagni]SMG52099.1 hypothetical protein SAMN06295960_3345 [Paenibacillus aquistagni]
MKPFIYACSGIFLIMITYYLNHIATSLAHMSKDSGPNEYFSAFSYLVGVLFIIRGLIHYSRQRNR